ncbi:MAG: hypothetical protein GY927_14315 [bacterium]|nr:hypothetical protein [bacterium]
MTVTDEFNQQANDSISFRILSPCEIIEAEDCGFEGSWQYITECQRNEDWREWEEPSEEKFSGGFLINNENPKRSGRGIKSAT